MIEGVEELKCNCDLGQNMHSFHNSHQLAGQEIGFLTILLSDLMGYGLEVGYFGKVVFSLPSLSE